MGLVSLEGMEFFAYHGFYEEEQKIGNKYSVDITVNTDMQEAALHDSLQGTVNYEVLYRIVKAAMQEPSRLLEHVASRIIDGTYQEYPAIHWVEVSISKFNPPIGGICYRSKVSLKR